MPSADPGEGRAALERELRGTPPPGLERLSDTEQAHLAALIAGARHRQAAELAAAADRALRFVPRLLRGPIRKVLG
jgi:hypothetical protein